MLNQPRRALRRDPLFLLAAGVSAVSLILYLVVPGGLSTSRLGYRILGIPILAMTALGILWDVRRHITSKERLFWGLLGFAFVAYILGQLVWAGGFLVPSLVIWMDFPLLLYYLLIFLAQEVRPHIAESADDGALRSLRVTALLTVVLAASAYFVVIPWTLTISPQADSNHSWGLYAAFDALLLVRFWALRRSSSDPVWRNTFGLLTWAQSATLVSSVWGGALAYVPQLVPGTSLLWDLTWHIPFPLFVLAARTALIQRVEAPAADGSGAAPSRFFRFEKAPDWPLAVTAVLLPAIHLSGYYLQILDPAVRRPRDLIVLLVIACVAGLVALRTALGRSPRVRRQEAEELRLLVEQSQDGFCLTDREGNIRWVNGAWATMHGFAREAKGELTGWSIRAFPREIDETLFETLFDPGPSPSASAAWRADHVRKDGSTVPVEVTASAFTDESGRQAGVGFVARDRTAEVRSRALRERMDLKVRESQKLESLAVMAGGIAHDFNNSLTAIIGNTSILLSHTPMDEPSFARMERVRASAEQASELTKQMLLYAGARKDRLVPLDLGSVIQGARDLLASVIPSNVTLTFDVGELPPVKGSAVQLRQIIVNLVMNGSEAIGDNPGTVHTTIRKAEVDSAWLADASFLATDVEPGPKLLLEVADTGAGMDPDTAQRIFEPFFTRKLTGRGLGLATVLGITRSHGGAIALRSAPGEGSLFCVALPFADDAVAPPPMPEPGDGPPLGKGTILVVEDDHEVRSVVAESLEAAGFATLQAADGASARALFAEHAEELAGIMLDLDSLRLDGAEILDFVRLSRPGIRAVVVSGHARADVQRRFPSDVAIIQKPFLPATLIRALSAGETASGPESSVA